MDFLPKFKEGIVQVSLIPGLLPITLEPLLSAECSGIVLQSFGAGNVPDWQDYGFQKFIERATQKGVPVVITSQFPANSTFNTHYAPGLRAVESGAIPTGNMTSSAAAVKFRWALARVTNEVKAGVLQSVCELDKLRDIMSSIYVNEMD
jgi:L-asparaginase/Glu-tRNA(Gln) amidotransferase subunit D